MAFEREWIYQRESLISLRLPRLVILKEIMKNTDLLKNVILVKVLYSLDLYIFNSMKRFSILMVFMDLVYTWCKIR